MRVIRHLRALLVCSTVCTLTGCGYMVGGAFQSDVRTVHVPIFGNETHRRGIEFLLTEAVQKEIQSNTPFRLAKGPYADTRLSGRIISFSKNVLGESFFDDPRELQVTLAVEVTWEDLRTGRVLAQQQVPIAPEVVQLLSQASFAPEVGPSLATATDDVVQRMARDIVNLMEAPW
ncbi:MAG: LptE family protein [Planctomycetaceae bacterium]